MAETTSQTKIQAMKCSRDNSVKKLYQLENVELPQGRTFADHKAAGDWVNFITSCPVWANNAALPKFIRVLSNGDNDYSEAREPNEIWLANNQLNAQVILHELAHFYPPCDGHGPRYVRAYLTLVAHFMGQSYHDLFVNAFRLNKIRF